MMFSRFVAEDNDAVISSLRPAKQSISISCGLCHRYLQVLFTTNMKDNHGYHLKKTPTLQPSTENNKINQYLIILVIICFDAHFESAERHSDKLKEQTLSSNKYVLRWFIF